MRATILTSLAIVAAVSQLALITLNAQSPQPIIVQAQSSSPAPVAPLAVTPPAVPANQAALKLLTEMKVANDEVLKKQEATLQALDELQKAADQIKVFTKRS